MCDLISFSSRSILSIALLSASRSENRDPEDGLEGGCVLEFCCQATGLRECSIEMEDVAMEFRIRTRQTAKWWCQRWCKLEDGLDERRENATGCEAVQSGGR